MTNVIFCLFFYIIFKCCSDMKDGGTTPMKKNIMNELYDKYQQGLLDKKEFEDMLVKAILANMRYFNSYRWKKDECMDYLSWFYPRLSRAIDTFKSTQATFKSYIGTLLRWSAREYQSRRENHDAAENSVWEAKLPELYVREEEPDYLKADTTDGIQKPDGKPARNRRQLLILALKCYYYCSDDFLERLAPSVGIKKEKLRHMVDNLRRQRIRKEETHRLMQERIHSQYYRCIVYEKRLKTMPENTAIYNKLETQLQKARSRLDAMRQRMAKLKLEATNEQIAQLLGLSKGTVDSNLHALKTRMKNSAETAASAKTPSADSYSP